MPLRSFDYPARQQRAVDAVVAAGHSALVSTSPADAAWLTGVYSSNIAVVVGQAVELFTDSRYADQARQTGLGVTIDRAVAQRAVEAAGGQAIAESEAGIIARLRSVKDAAEVEALQQATQVSLAALRQLLTEIQVGQTELQVARRLEQLMADHGADDRSFPTIVAGGANSAVPHHIPTRRELQRGDCLKIDFGAQVDGYHADVTRTFVVGAPASERMSEVALIVAAAAGAARTTARAGVAVQVVDEAARAVVRDAGYGEFFIHGLGHGLGIEVHESPLISATGAGTLDQANVVTIEPGIYLPGEFGVRIEDVCLVQKGECDVLSDFPRELVRVG